MSIWESDWLCMKKELQQNRANIGYKLDVHCEIGNNISPGTVRSIKRGDTWSHVKIKEVPTHG